MSICYEETKKEVEIEVVERDDFGWGFFIGRPEWERSLAFF